MLKYKHKSNPGHNKHHMKAEHQWAKH